VSDVGDQILYIIGAGGHGRVAADVAESLGYKKLLFIDDRWPEMNVNSIWPVVACDVSEIPIGSNIFVAIGNNQTRLVMLKKLGADGFKLPPLVHPRAHLSQHARVSSGTLIAAMASVNVCADIGEGVIINTAASIDHDCKIADGVHVSPGARLAGGVSVGVCTWIGIGASVRENIQIGQNAIVGAGAVVVSNIENNTTYFGNPARMVK
jgi:sugar O-acyltransferase (sialic acid O-acetyltransferase NeuD family)